MVDTSHDSEIGVVPSNTPDQDTSDYEALAREMGWRPEGEFKGDKSRFVDAKTFYERGLTILPIVQAENSALRAAMARTQEDARRALEIAERAHTRELDQVREELAATKLVRKEAVTENDGDKFEAAEARIAQLEEQLKARPSQEAPPLDPGYTAWLDRPEQAWFRGDDEAQAMADGLARLSKYKPLIGQREKLWDAVIGDIKKMRDGQRAGVKADLERPGPQGAGKGNGEVRRGAGTRSYDNLSEEFRKQCDRQYKDFGISTTKEKWRERYVSGISEDAFRK